MTQREGEGRIVSDSEERHLALAQRRGHRAGRRHPRASCGPGTPTRSRRSSRFASRDKVSRSTPGNSRVPDAALEYIDFFTDVFSRAAADLERVVAEVPQGVQRAHVDMLRQIASNAAAEQRRCLLFRDKWISRPLPYEQIGRCSTRSRRTRATNSTITVS